MTYHIDHFICQVIQQFDMTDKCLNYKGRNTLCYMTFSFSDRYYSVLF